jgi:hypothetical protein
MGGRDIPGEEARLMVGGGGGGDAILTASHVPAVKVSFFLKETPPVVFCETALWKLCGLLFGHCKGPCRRTWLLLS